MVSENEISRIKDLVGEKRLSRLSEASREASLAETPEDREKLVEEKEALKDELRQEASRENYRRIGFLSRLVFSEPAGANYRPIIEKISYFLEDGQADVFKEEHPEIAEAILSLSEEQRDFLVKAVGYALIDCRLVELLFEYIDFEKAARADRPLGDEERELAMGRLLFESREGFSKKAKGGIRASDAGCFVFLEFEEEEDLKDFYMLDPSGAKFSKSIGGFFSSAYRFSGDSYVAFSLHVPVIAVMSGGLSSKHELGHYLESLVKRSRDYSWKLKRAIDSFNGVITNFSGETKEVQDRLTKEVRLALESIKESFLEMAKDEILARLWSDNYLSFEASLKREDGLSVEKRNQVIYDYYSRYFPEDIKIPDELKPIFEESKDSYFGFLNDLKDFFEDNLFNRNILCNDEGSCHALFAFLHDKSIASWKEDLGRAYKEEIAGWKLFGGELKEASPKIKDLLFVL